MKWYDKQKKDMGMPVETLSPSKNMDVTSVGKEHQQSSVKANVEKEPVQIVSIIQEIQ